MFGGVLWVLYSGFCFGRDRALWAEWIKPMLLALLLSLWFWLPAVAEKNLIILDTASNNNQTIDHLVVFKQLISDPLQFGYSFKTPVDTLSLSVGLLPLVSLVIISLWHFKYGRKQKLLSRQTLFLTITAWLLFILQTPLATFFWKSLPLVSFIQFPWRLSLFFIVFTAPLIALVWQFSKGFKTLLILLFVIQLLAVWHLQPADRLHKNIVDYDLFPQSTSTLNENLTHEFTYLDIGDWAPEPRVLTGEANFTVEHWTGSSRRYQLSVKQEALIVEPTMNFAGWQTRANGTLVEYTANEQTQGRLAYQLAPGEYQIKTRFTQQTWPRIVGNIVSGLSLLIWGWLIWREKHLISGKLSA
jgi:hypothetical protein